MSGFDNGTLQSGIFAQTKQFGSIIRGFGPPVPQAGVVGDLFIDVQTSELYNKRSTDANADVDPWGHYLFVIPDPYKTRLKWFSSSMPTNDIGIDGDYCLLWGGYPNYGMQPSIFGPKAAGAWPSPPTAVAVTLNPLYTAEDTHEIPGAPWTAYTPDLTANTGGLTTAAATGRYQQIGKTINFVINATITTNGSAAVSLIATLPPFVNGVAQAEAVGQNVNTLKGVIGFIQSGANNVNMFYADGTYPGGNGAIIVLSGTYESA